MLGNKHQVKTSLQKCLSQILDKLVKDLVLCLLWLEGVAATARNSRHWDKCNEVSKGRGLKSFKGWSPHTLSKNFLKGWRLKG